VKKYTNIKLTTYDVISETDNDVSNNNSALISSGNPHNIVK